MQSIVLNSSLASGLGRPDLAYRLQGGGAVQTGVPPIASVVAGDGSVAFDWHSNTPLLLLALMVVGYAGFAYWVRPHLA